MIVVVSTVFRLIMFPHKGNIFKFDQLYYYTSDPASMDSVPYVGKSITPYEDIGVVFLKDSTLMGNFSMPPPNIPRTISNINMIISSTMPFDDPWILPLKYELDLYGSEIPLSLYKLEYVAVQSLFDPPSTKTDQVNMISDKSSPLSGLPTTPFPDPFHQVFSTDEIVQEIISFNDLPWENIHHCSYFLPKLDKI